MVVVPAFAVTVVIVVPAAIPGPAIVCPDIRPAPLPVTEMVVLLSAKEPRNETCDELAENCAVRPVVLRLSPNWSLTCSVTGVLVGLGPAIAIPLADRLRLERAAVGAWLSLRARPRIQQRRRP